VIVTKPYDQLKLFYPIKIFLKESNFLLAQ